MEKVQRKYTFADATLTYVAQLLYAFVTRDLAEFASYGYSADTLATLADLTTAFKTVPSNTNLEQTQAGFTLRKEQKQAALVQAIREVTNRARLVLMEDSPEYKRFGIKGMANMADDDLAVCATNATAVATELLPQISVRGVTSDLIAAILLAGTEFEAAHLAQDQNMADREIQTDSRISQGNALYALTVELADAGKSIWFGMNQEAKYNDYVLYTVQGSTTVTPLPTPGA